MTIPRLVTLAIAGVVTCPASTAFVQYESGRAGNGWIELKFRHSLVAGWQIESALLFLHLQRGDSAGRVDISIPGGKALARIEARPEASGWISIALPKPLAAGIVRQGVRIRWTGSARLDGSPVPGRAPYVVVTGLAVR
jgi:hypothetical protein